MNLKGNIREDFPPIKQIDLIHLIREINRKLDDFSVKGLYDVWLPKKAVMRFFDYGETQMRQLEKENKIVVSKIGARKFYSVQSILNLIEANK